MTGIKPSHIIMIGGGVRGQGVGHSRGPQMVEDSTVEASMDIRSIVRVVSDLGGVPGVGWFVPLCPSCTLWAIQ